MKSLLPLCAAILLAACSSPYHPAHIVEADARFPGLIDVLAAQPEHQLDVLLVHGICTHDASWAARTVAQLGTALQAATGARSAASTPLPDGQIGIVPATLSTPDGTLRFKSLIWSPLTQPLKRQLCYDQTNKSSLCQGTPPYTPTRASLNALLKDVLLDDCLADAMIYAGVARDAIQLRMRDALLAATADQAPTAPLFVVAESLGSSILFDTLLRMMDEAPGSAAARAARQIALRLRYLEMAANPIPLLGLADQNLPAAPAAPSIRGNDSLQRFLLRRQQLLAPNETSTQLLLIAYSDPNDVLSYTLPPALYARRGIAVFNVLASNATTYLGLLERPDLAHMDYLNNPDVGRLIACGQPASPLCK